MFTDILFFRACTCGGNPHVAGNKAISRCNGAELLTSMSDSEDMDEDMKDISKDAMSNKHDHKWKVCSCDEHSVSYNYLQHVLLYSLECESSLNSFTFLYLCIHFINIYTHTLMVHYNDYVQ